MLIASALLTACAPAAASSEPPAGPTAAPGSLFVDAGQGLGRISPLVYGTNVGPWQNLTPSMMPFIEAAGFRFLRFPGGNWGDEYLLTRARFDDFISLARQLDAEPMVNVRLFHGDPEDAAEWIRYANLEQGYAIRYWAIGNEPSLYESNRRQAGYDTEVFNQDWRRFAEAMKAVDASILLLGPETHQYTGQGGGVDPVDSRGRDWMRAFLEANGDLVDIVSFHRYPFGASDPTVDQLLSNSPEWDGIIPRLRQLIVETTGRQLPIAVTEVNSNWSNRFGGAATPDSIASAIWWTDVIGRLMVEQVDIVAHFALEGAGGLGLMAFPEPRPVYYVFPLLKQFGDELLYADSGLDSVGLYAARRQDGAVSLLIVNRSTEPACATLMVDGLAPPWRAERWLLDADHLASQLQPRQLDPQRPLALPAASVSLLVLKEE